MPLPDSLSNARVRAHYARARARFNKWLGALRAVHGSINLYGPICLSQSDYLKYYFK